MRGIEDSIKELKDQIAKLDQLIGMGKVFIHTIDMITGEHSIDELSPDIQEDYLEIMKDIAESQALKRDLEIMMHAAENICNRAAAYEDNVNECGEGDKKDE